MKKPKKRKRAPGGGRTKNTFVNTVKAEPTIVIRIPKGAKKEVLATVQRYKESKKDK